MSSSSTAANNEFSLHSWVDDAIDIIDQAKGKHTAQNKPGDTCGGGKPVGRCSTVNELARQLIVKIQTFEQNPLDSSHPKLFNTGEPVKSDITCDECQMLCRGTARVINGAPTEQIRYTFENPGAATGTIQGNNSISQKPIFPTSFEGDC